MMKRDQALLSGNPRVPRQKTIKSVNQRASFRNGSGRTGETSIDHGKRGGEQWLRRSGNGRTGKDRIVTFDAWKSREEP
jgi:hypothetical protein